MKSIFLSASMGVLAILLVNLSGAFTGVSLGLNPISIGISSVLGISGVILMLVLSRIIL